MEDTPMHSMLEERIWAEINLDNLLFNYQQIQKMAGGAKLMPIIKADAYGHGAVMVARTLRDAGAEYFAVATADEAIQLRRFGITCTILVLGVVPSGRVQELAEKGITLCIPDSEVATLYKNNLRRYEKLNVHLKLDSGMNRLGVEQSKAKLWWSDIKDDSSFCIKGIFTHFAASGEDDKAAFTIMQYDRFSEIISYFGASSFLLTHCANSDAIVRFPQTHLNLVRPGIILYGYATPSPRLLKLRPVMSLRASIAQVKHINAGQSVGYSCAWKATRDTKIAVVSAGYADGILRSGSGNICMLVNGVRSPQIGNICMDLCIIDVTDAGEVHVGDVATILGEDLDQSINVYELSQSYGGTIPYEVFSSVGKRVPRYYYKANQLVSVVKNDIIFSNI